MSINTVKAELPELFSAEEYQQLIFIANRCGPFGPTEKQRQRFIEICEETRVKADILSLLLKGYLRIACFDENGEPQFEPLPAMNGAA
jgi:hypothetical protein